MNKLSLWGLILELVGDLLLIIFSLEFAIIFFVIAWQGLIVWEHRPLAIFEAVFALFVVALGVERFIKDWRG